MENSEQPAYPTLEQTGNVEAWNTYPGLTKREYFAGLAMQGWLASWPKDHYMKDYDSLAKKCVEIADALLTHLSTNKK